MAVLMVVQSVLFADFSHAQATVGDVIWGSDSVAVTRVFTCGCRDDSVIGPFFGQVDGTDCHRDGVIGRCIGCAVGGPAVSDADGLRCSWPSSHGREAPWS